MAVASAKTLVFKPLRLRPSVQTSVVIFWVVAFSSLISQPVMVVHVEIVEVKVVVLPRVTVTVALRVVEQMLAVELVQSLGLSVGYEATPSFPMLWATCQFR